VVDAPYLWPCLTSSHASAGATVSSESADAFILVDHRVDRVADAIRIGRRSLYIARPASLPASLSRCSLWRFAAAGDVLPVQGTLLQEAIDVGVIVNAPRASKTERRSIEQLLSNGGGRLPKDGASVRVSRRPWVGRRRASH
jgi:cation transport ATPase